MSTRQRSLLFTLILIATACGLRWPGWGKTIWNPDEGVTFTMAEVIRKGGVLYRDAADHRTPLVPYLKALILTVVGDWNIRGVHIVLAIMVGLTAVCLWRIGRQAKDGFAGALAAVYFTLLSFTMLGTADAIAAHTGWFMIFFSALGMWAFVAALSAESGLLAALAGTAFALAALAKQPGVLDWGVCLVLCALIAWTTPTRRSLALRLALMLLLGFIWPLFGTCVYFAANGSWHDFIQYSWSYNTQFYVPEVPFRERLHCIRMPLLLARDNTPFACWLGMVGAVWLLTSALPNLWKRSHKFSPLLWLILGWTASGLVSTILSGREFVHYSIQVLPGLSLACGWVTARCWEKSAGWEMWGHQVGRWAVRLGLGVGLLSLAITAAQRTRISDLSDGISKDIGLVVKARTRPDEMIFVWGYEPEVHVFSQRFPNTRFLYSNFLTGMIPWTNLDALKNTDYAIVPGAWDAFWHDFTLHPPSMIVDTRGNRGYLKYPLRQQSRLWNIIESQYAEVAVDYASSRGYALYQRATSAPPTDLKALPEDNRLQISIPEHHPLRPIKILVKSPDDTTAIDLFLDGRPYRRVENPDRGAVQTSFFILKSDLTVGNHSLKAVARGSQDLASANQLLTVEPAANGVVAFEGPPLTFMGREILPTESESGTEMPVTLRKDRGVWDAFAPSRLVYPRPDGLVHLNFSFGIFAEAYERPTSQKTDGFDVSVFFEDETKKQIQLYRRNLDPASNGADRGMVSGHATVPGTSGGRIIFMITPGAMNIPAFDWTYWRNIDGDTPIQGPIFRGQPTPIIEWEAKLGLGSMIFENRRVDVVHAPSHFAFRQSEDMEELSGFFGVLPEAWQGPQQTNGVVFEIEQIPPNGASRVLFHTTLYPGNKPTDRELQSFRLSLDHTKGSLIRCNTRPVDPNNNAFNYAFWHGLTISEFAAYLAFEEHTIRSLHSEAVNGFNYMDEEGFQVLLAHAPSKLIFPLELRGKRLEGKIGLLHGAYSETRDTDGAVFLIEVESATGERRELFRRYLNPRDDSADRGAIPFSVDLAAPGAGSRLILRTESAPTGRLNFAWSYWRDLRLIP